MRYKELAMKFMGYKRHWKNDNSCKIFKQSFSWSTLLRNWISQLCRIAWKANNISCYRVLQETRKKLKVTKKMNITKTVGFCSLITDARCYFKCHGLPCLASSSTPKRCRSLVLCLTWDGTKHLHSNNWMPFLMPGEKKPKKHT